jgi:hypothetical protein
LVALGRKKAEDAELPALQEGPGERRREGQKMYGLAMVLMERA